MIRIFRSLAVSAALFATAGFTLSAAAQGQADPQAVLADKGFVTPANDIANLALAPRYLNATLTDVSPNKRWFIHEVGDGPVTMDRFSKDFDELGGLFIDYSGNRSRDLTIRTNIGINIISAADGSVVEMDVPTGARVSNATWSPDGARVAFYVHTDTETHIYVGDPATGDSRQVTRRPVLATMVTGFEWTSGSSEIATVLVPNRRSERPRPSRIPSGPQVKQTEDGKNMLRTYASLMATPYDETLLEWHATGQLAVVNVANRNVTEMGAPAMITSFDFAPNGQHARIETMQKPFSYIVPVRSFGSLEEVWGRNGAVMAELERTETQTGLDGNLPTAPGVGGSDDEPDRRQLGWREDGSGLTFLQQEPAPAGETDTQANGRGAARRADKVMLWAPPFDDSSLSVVYQASARMASARFSSDHQTLFVTERPGGGERGAPGGNGASGTVKEYAVDLSAPETTYSIAEYASDDFYANPGSLLLEGGRVPAGGRGGFGGGGNDQGTVQTSADGRFVYLYGNTYNRDPMAEGPKNFLDRVEFRTGEKSRVFESSNDEQYERIISVLDVDAASFVVSTETPMEVEQSYRLSDGRRIALTRNVDYSPEMTSAPRQRFTVERPDGFRFLVNVTLPPGYEEGTRLPAMFWFYPREYTDQENYDETARTYNKNAFPNFGTRSMQYLVQQGYAVIEPDAPIIGDAGQMNNNYENDLRNNLAAVIDELDAREIIDRRRLGLGGHSYGAFSTVNAMVHTPFFKAGIAGDGNYNRTFTPLMFQSERRVLWDAKDVYLSMSPLLYANNMTGALLMYHGMHDQNVGTAPDHSPRLFHALNGLDKEAAMYLYPYEDHGPASRNTILDLWGRWTAWLDVHLKDATTQPITEDND
ncbi:MAG: prolyl oligopeptidase family serine peptidase [Gemmatimonadetes bacterium]|nr:prolyl oligopeptidase family serine peptidase [Gemmatimonadota bacterium]MDA1102337.1 prolyl oligopeptidase family serine peptidase [Gemmatimonadota bacterium]